MTVSGSKNLSKWKHSLQLERFLAHLIKCLKLCLEKTPYGRICRPGPYFADPGGRKVELGTENHTALAAHACAGSNDPLRSQSLLLALD
jgi:hypothetical protein